MAFQPRCSNPGPYASGSIIKLKTSVPRRLAGLTAIALIWGAVASGVALAQANIESQKHNDSAQDGSSAQIPFEVSNPKHMKWPELEAGRIYTQACDLLARSIRPEHPPVLRPKFRLVLGADTDEFVRDAAVTEIHLKSWNPEKFAQGVVVVALRDLVPRTDLARLARLSVSLAGSTVDISEIQGH
jgi:hypothetical protein